MNFKSAKFSEKAVSEPPLRLLRKVGHICDDKKPWLYSQGDRHFLATICETQVQVYEIEHLRPVFSFNTPWKPEMVACQNEHIFVSDGTVVACYERSELVGTFQTTDLILQILPLGTFVAVLHPYSISLLSIPEMCSVENINIGVSRAINMLHPRNYKNKLLIMHEDGHFSLWNVSKKVELYSFDKYLPTEAPNSFSLTRDDDILVFGWSSGSIQLRNIKTDLVLAEFQTKPGLRDLSFRMDGKAQLICLFSDGTFTLFNFEVENEHTIVNVVFETQAHLSDVIFSTFLEDRPVLLSCAVNSIKEWHIEGNEIKFIRQRMGIGKSAKYIDFYNISSEIADTVLSITNDPVSLCVSNIYADNRSFEISKSAEVIPPCNIFAKFDQRELKWDNIATGHGHVVCLWSVAQSKLNCKAILKFDFNVNHLAISSCGNYFVCALENGSIQVYNMQSQRKVVECMVEESPVFVSFDSSSKGLIVVCATGTIYGSSDFRSKSFSSIINLDIRCTMGKYFVDRGLLFVACDDFSLRCVDLDTCRQVRVFSGHQASISDFCATLDGRWLLTLSKDSTIRIWDMTSGLESLSLKVEDQPLAIAVSPQGDQIVTSHADKLGLKLWYFEPLNIKGVVLFEESCDATREVQLAEVKVNGGSGRQRWLSILHWDELRSKSVPAMPLNKSQSTPFFLSDLAYEALKRKEKESAEKVFKEAERESIEVASGFDFAAPTELSGKTILSFSPSKVYALYNEIGNDSLRHEYMLQVFIYLLDGIPTGGVQLDIVVALLKIYFDVHANVATKHQEMVNTITTKLDALYRPLEDAFMNTMGMISFVKGTLI